MPYVRRDGDGQILAVSVNPMTDGTEALEPGHPDLMDFYARSMAAGDGTPFVSSDLDFIRVLEDVIEALMRKGILTLTDLPGSAQDKLVQRRALRGVLAGVQGLFGDDGGKIG